MSQQYARADQPVIGRVEQRNRDLVPGIVPNPSDQVVQTNFGVKPYSGLMGGLKVKDAVEVRLSAVFPEPA